MVGYLTLCYGASKGAGWVVGACFFPEACGGKQAPTTHPATMIDTWCDYVVYTIVFDKQPIIFDNLCYLCKIIIQTKSYE